MLSEYELQKIDANNEFINAVDLLEKLTKIIIKQKKILDFTNLLLNDSITKRKCKRLVDFSYL